ncbi:MULTISPECIES: hypothetical protein [unclassified Mesobacillus]|uniref:hypothetical protein n=1 Tax=unclassified Mesobacillus TaxID=2675270 RepID=UPI00204242D2|nr:MULTISPECIES: hypothetical protein [unclassified Mesobacillus]MCM3121822.1 hypothetical protein [Mesobacillus sp. MER 33]MCM3231786.1 hypothetical protein [Mesobacillus sp. MER 48]
MMWTWIWYLILPIVLLLLIEEISQFIWRHYLKNPEEDHETMFIRIRNSMKGTLKKYRKDPSH